ncbi:MAG: DUF2341 domain-containing protein, partial [Candidatus Hodarchaeales archaeon]
MRFVSLYSKKVLINSLFLSIFFINIIVIGTQIQPNEEFLESNPFLAEILRGVGVLNNNNDTYHAVPILSGTALTNSPSDESQTNLIRPSYQSQYSVPGWVDTRWQFRQNITIQASQIPSDLTDYPFLIETISTDLYNNVQVDGGDIFFTNSTGDKLDHEIEKLDWYYSATQVHLVAWVRIPTLSSTVNTEISMYYGNPTSPNQENPTGVWDSNYLMVQHLEESSGTIEDSTNNSYDGTAQNGAEIGVTGKIGDGASFDGANDVITGTSTHSYSYDDFTLSAIYQSAESFLVDDQYIFSHQIGYIETGIVMAVSDDTVGRAPMRISIYNDTTSFGQRYGGTVNITTKTWHYLVGVRDNDMIRLYVDGVLDRTRASIYGGVTIEVIDGTLNIGDMPGETENVHGLLDEIRVSTSVRSADWILTNYRNIFSPGSFYSVSSQEERPITDDWTFPLLRYRKNFSVNSSLVSGSNNLTNFPMLVEIYDADLHDTSKIQNDADDLRFAAEEDWVWTDNLVSNGDFEAGSLSGWTTSGNWQVGTNPAMGDSGPQSGSYCAYISTNAMASDYIQQDVDISSYSSYISNGKALVDFSGWLVASESPGDESRIRVQFLDVSKVLISSPLDTGLVTPSSWTKNSLMNFLIPSNTRYIRVWATSFEEGWDSGSVDSFSVKIGTLQTSSAGFPIDHEIELFDQTGNGTHAHLVAWVNVPSLSGTLDTNITMYYGNNAIGDQTDLGSVWINNYAGIWHLSEDPSGSSPQIKDSTVNSFDGTSTGGMTSGDLVSGQIHKSIDFDGDNDYIDVGTNSSLKLTSAFTVEGWYNGITDTVNEDRAPLYSNGFDFNNDIGIRVQGFHQSDNKKARITYGNGTFLDFVESDNDIIENTWNHLATTYDGSTLKLYINGIKQIEEGTWSIAYNSAAGYIGAYPSNAFHRFNGSLDEIRVSSVVRSSDWILTEYRNQNETTSFYSVSDEEVYDRWWKDASFVNRKDIVIDKSQANSDLTNYPLLIDITDSSFKTGQVQSDADDFLFTDANGTKLPHEIEYFYQGGSSGQLIAWVKVPLLFSSEDTVISMYYSDINTNQLTNQEHPEDVWDSNYLGVWHLSEDPTGTIYDSTSNNNDAISYGSMASNDQVSGQISGSLDFDGTDDYISWTTAMSRTTGTYSWWMYANSVTGERNYIANGAYRERISLWDDVVKIETDTDDEYFEFDQSSISANTWTHIVFVRSGDVGNIYINGYNVQQVTETGADFLTVSCIGGTSDATRMVDGIIDEVHISSTASSADRILAEFENQESPNTFYSVGTEVTFDLIPPVIEDFGIDDPGTGTGKFWAIVSDSTSDVTSVKITINNTEYSMSNNNTHWIYQHSGVEWQKTYEYLITNASDSLGNYVETNSSTKYYTFTYDAQTPDVLEWKYMTNTNTFRANVSDSWGELDTVIVNITSHSAALPDPPTQIMSFYQDFGVDGLGYINDTMAMS